MIPLFEHATLESTNDKNRGEYLIKINRINVIATFLDKKKVIEESILF